MAEQVVYSSARSVPLKFRTSMERKAELRRLAAEAGVSMQTYVEAKVFGLTFEEVRAPGPQKRQAKPLPGFDDPPADSEGGPLRPTG